MAEHGENHKLEKETSVKNAEATRGLGTIQERFPNSIAEFRSDVKAEIQILGDGSAKYVEDFRTTLEEHEVKYPQMVFKFGGCMAVSGLGDSVRNGSKEHLETQEALHSRLQNLSETMMGVKADREQMEITLKEG